MLSSVVEDYGREINDAFVAALNQELEGDGVVEWHNYRDIRLEFNTGKLEACIQSTGEPLSNFRFVYFKSYLRYTEQATVIAEYLQSEGIPFVCSELKKYLPQSKLTQYGRLSLADIPIPQTVFLDYTQLPHQYGYLQESLGSPFVFKAIDGKGGNQNYLIRSEQELLDALAEHPEVQFVAQRFIANDSDLRILVLDNVIQLVIHRSRQGDDSHLNNTSQGGAAKLLDTADLAPEHRALALKSAQLLDREVAGVDLMFESGTGNPYILEVNASPQVGSGAFKEEKIKVYSNYFKNMLK